MPHNQQHHTQLSHRVAKTATAVAIGGSMMLLSGLTLVATVIGLVLVTPLLVIFSPVLVPAIITLGLILGGFAMSGGLGATATFVLFWMYRYVTGKHPVGSGQLDMAREKIAGVATEVRQKAEQLGNHRGITGQAGHQVRVEHHQAGVAI